MKIEDLMVKMYDMVPMRLPLWVKVWMFFFTLINRKEGKELVRDILIKLEYIQRMQVDLIFEVINSLANSEKRRTMNFE